MCQRVLSHAVLLVGHELFIDVGHAICRSDGTAHVNRLTQHDGTRPNVSRVGSEGIVDSLPELVTRLGKGLAELRHDSAQLLCEVGRDGSLLSQPHESARNAAAHVGHHRGAELRECRLLVVAQNGNLATEKLVASHGIYLWQVFRASSFPQVACHLFFHASNAQLLVVAQGQVTTLFQRQNLLRRSR